MATERTLSIIKPDATKRNLTGKIVTKFEDAGLRVVASKRIHLSPAQAGAFYAEHAARPFYGELVEYMASEPVVIQVLEGEGAIAKNRDPGVGQAYRVTVQMDRGGARAYDLPSTGELRIGDRVRVQNGQLFRY